MDRRERRAVREYGLTVVDIAGEVRTHPEHAAMNVVAAEVLARIGDHLCRLTETRAGKQRPSAAVNRGRPAERAA